MGSWRAFFFFLENLLFLNLWCVMVGCRWCPGTSVRSRTKFFDTFFWEEGGVQIIGVLARTHSATFPVAHLEELVRVFFFFVDSAFLVVCTQTPFRHRRPPCRWFSRTDRSEERPVHQGTQTLCEFLLAALGQQTGAVHQDASGKDTPDAPLCLKHRFGCKGRDRQGGYDPKASPQNLLVLLACTKEPIRAADPRVLHRRLCGAELSPLCGHLWPLRWRRVVRAKKSEASPRTKASRPRVAVNDDCVGQRT